MKDRLNRLPVEVEAYQNQVFDPKTGQYTGFQCPEQQPKCPIKKADGLEIDQALKRVGDVMELDHIDGQRFCQTGTTHAEQVVVRCTNCHVARHSTEAGYSRKS